jgi:hypothetical protein
VSVARERTPDEPARLALVDEPGTGVDAAAPGPTIPVGLVAAVVAVEAVWLIGIAYLVYRLVAGIV